MQPHDRCTQLEVYKMARILQASFVLVLTGRIAVCPFFVSRSLLWWSWLQSLSVIQRIRKSSWSLNNSQWASLRNTTLYLFESGVWLRNWVHSVGNGNGLVAGSISRKLKVYVFHISIWFSLWGLSVYQLVFPYPSSLSLISLLLYLIMVRRRGIPRRGSNLGSRGGQRGRGSSTPRRITPLATASPSSQPSDDSGPSLNSSLHTSRFKFKSKLNKPLISAIITVIFSEEEDEVASVDEDPKELSSSLNASASQSSSADAVLQVSAEMHEEDNQEEADTQRNSPQEQIMACESRHLYESVLYPVPPPDGKLMEVEDEVMVTWERLPEQVKENDAGEHTQV